MGDMMYFHRKRGVSWQSLIPCPECFHIDISCFLSGEWTFRIRRIDIDVVYNDKYVMYEDTVKVVELLSRT
jgi:hypothetical protein